MALDVLQSMTVDEIPRNTVAFSSVLSACEKAGEWTVTGQRFVAVSGAPWMKLSSLPRKSLALIGRSEFLKNGSIQSHLVFI